MLLNRFVVWILLVCAFMAACGVSVPPSGGPEDKTAPKIVETVPARDSAGVAPDSRIRIAFSEDMTRKGVERLVELSPEVEILKVDWDGRVAILTPATPLHPDTTYVVSVESGFRDNHGVAQKEAFRFAFATSAAIDSGSVAGKVFFRREPTEQGIVRCWVLPADSGFSPQASRPDRQAPTKADGVYELRYLSNRNVRYALWAFQDADGNGVFDPQKEVGWERVDTVALTPMLSSLSSRDIFIVDPNEPAELAGRVDNRTGIDTLRVSVALFAPNDTTPPAYYTRCDTAGSFSFRSVMMGTYALRAFIDFHADSLCGEYPCPPDSATMCLEPCAIYADSVTLAPGESIELNVLPLEMPVGPGGTSDED